MVILLREPFQKVKTPILVMVLHLKLNLAKQMITTLTQNEDKFILLNDFFQGKTSKKFVQ